MSAGGAAPGPRTPAKGPQARANTPAGPSEGPAPTGKRGADSRAAAEPAIKRARQESGVLTSQWVGSTAKTADIRAEHQPLFDLAAYAHFLALKPAAAGGVAFAIAEQAVTLLLPAMPLLSQGRHTCCTPDHFCDVNPSSTA